VNKEFPEDTLYNKKNTKNTKETITTKEKVLLTNHERIAILSPIDYLLPTHRNSPISTNLLIPVNNFADLPIQFVSICHYK